MTARRSVQLLLASAACALVACGGDDSPTTSPEETSGPAATEDTIEEGTVVVSDGRHITADLDLVLLINIFDRAGNASDRIRVKAF